MTIDDACNGTGFQICQFDPDGDPCEACGSTNVQLYFGNQDYWHTGDGEYLCEKCVIDLHFQNIAYEHEYQEACREHAHE